MHAVGAGRGDERGHDRLVAGVERAILVEVEHAARAGGCAPAGLAAAEEPVIRRVHVAVGVVVAEIRSRLDDRLAVLGVEHPLQHAACEVGQRRHVVIGVLAHDRVPVLELERHDLVDVLRAVIPLHQHVVRAVAHLDHLLAIVPITERAVEIAGMGDDLLDPPAQGVILRRVQRRRVRAADVVRGDPLHPHQPVPRVILVAVPLVLDEVARVVIGERLRRAGERVVDHQRVGPVVQIAVGARVVPRLHGLEPALALGPQTDRAVPDVGVRRGNHLRALDAHDVARARAARDTKSTGRHGLYSLVEHLPPEL
ncbi:MAG: hypothetical protein FLDDKLPJ_03716 [Phycisphaerae bacterium]|nr:hypothetical protein [Phycisphaerae bacterium]